MDNKHFLKCLMPINDQKTANQNFFQILSYSIWNSYYQEKIIMAYAGKTMGKEEPLSTIAGSENWEAILEISVSSER